MAIEREDLRPILRAVKRLQLPERLLILGDVTLHFDSQALSDIARSEGFTLSYVPQSLDASSFGAALGFEHTDTLDVVGNVTLRVNLHDPVPEELVKSYNVVVDAGVLFWCFDPASALRNILSMTRTGGFIIHITAISGHYGRGYYNIHPLLLEDFYLGNSCEFVESTYRTKFRAPGLLGTLMKLAGFGNEVTRNSEPGNVYLDKSRLNRISFRTEYRRPLEADRLPNNVIGVLVFNKRSCVQPEDIVIPVRSHPYSKKPSSAED